ncbi:MAG: hypothetical protein WAU69_12475, partial [Solirubrobacteraceae bacterium]
NKFGSAPGFDATLMPPVQLAQYRGCKGAGTAAGKPAPEASRALLSGKLSRRQAIYRFVTSVHRVVTTESYHILFTH